MSGLRTARPRVKPRLPHFSLQRTDPSNHELPWRSPCLPTILVVDDSPTEQKIILESLKPTGHQVITADDGEQALEMARKHRPELILLDVILPKKNGFQVCRQLKTSPETEAIKVVLVTSKTQDSDRFWGLKQGADDYLGKPFTDDELQSTLSKFL